MITQKSHWVCRTVSLCVIAVSVFACAPCARFAFSPFAPSFDATYFPKGAFDASRPGRDFEMSKEWGKLLRNLEEPSLFSHHGSLYEAYRFMWARAWQSTIVIRVERRGDDRLLSYSELCNPAKCSAATIERTSTVRLSNSLWRKLTNSVLKSSFWDASSQAPDSLLPLDGTSWVIEGYREGTYHSIHRRTDPLEDHVDPLWTVADTFLSLM